MSDLHPNFRKKWFYFSSTWDLAPLVQLYLQQWYWGWATDYIVPSNDCWNERLPCMYSVAEMQYLSVSLIEPNSLLIGFDGRTTNCLSDCVSVYLPVTQVALRMEITFFTGKQLYLVTIDKYHRSIRHDELSKKSKLMLNLWMQSYAHISPHLWNFQRPHNDQRLKLAQHVYL